MSNCTECGTELEPLDTTCSTCGSARDDSRRNESELAKSSVAEMAPMRTDTPQIYLLFIVVLGLFTILNFVMYPLIEHSHGNREEFAVSLWVGTIMAQFALVSTWWVFAPPSLFQRSLWGVVNVVLWTGAFVVSFANVEYGRYSGSPNPIPFHVIQELLAIAAALPLLFLATQASLWCARFWFRWRVQGPDVAADLAANRPVEHRPLRILDVMIATAAVAIALAVAKLSKQGGLLSDAEHLGILLVVAGIITGVAMLSLLPCLAIGLRRPTIKGGIGALTLLHAGYVCAVLTITGMIVGQAPPDDTWGAYFLAVGTYFTIVMVVLRACRRCGYTLRLKNE